ncbi:predicted protein [Postia placenta Mad-698-R]|nr:predicted protein [Postia placenta Mad-698-R]
MKRHVSAPPEEPARRVGVVVDNVFLEGIINEAKERKEKERQTKAIPIPPPRSANPEPPASPVTGPSRPRPDTPVVFRKVDPDWTPDTTQWTWDSSWPNQKHLSGEEWMNVGRNARKEWFDEEEDDGVDWELYGDGEHLHERDITDPEDREVWEGADKPPERQDRRERDVMEAKDAGLVKAAGYVEQEGTQIEILHTPLRSLDRQPAYIGPLSRQPRRKGRQRGFELMLATSSCVVNVIPSGTYLSALSSINPSPASTHAFNASYSRSAPSSSMISNQISTGRGRSMAVMYYACSDTVEDLYGRVTKRCL